MADNKTDTTVTASSPGEIPRSVRLLVPILLGIAVIGFWEFAVYYWKIPKFIFPAPSMIVQALIFDLPTLSASLWTTVKITLAAFFIASVLGICAAVLNPTWEAAACAVRCSTLCAQNGLAAAFARWTLDKGRAQRARCARRTPTAPAARARRTCVMMSCGTMAMASR